MPVNDTTTNNAFPYPTSDNDGSDFATGIAEFAAAVDGMWMKGTLASLPAASAVQPGTEYYATDANIVLLAVGSGTSASTWLQSMFSPGDIKCSAVSSPPSGWLACNGAAISRSIYSVLYSVIGTTYGVGDGSTTFNLPNLGGKVIIGESGSYALGSSGGSTTQTLEVGNLPDYNLDLAGNTPWAVDGSFSSGDVGPGTGELPETPVTNGGWSGQDTINSGGSGESFSIMQPYLTLNYFIKY